MPKYEVTWEELRTIKCSAEVTAKNKEEAVKAAQNYDFDVEENEAYTDEILPGRATLIEDEESEDDQKKNT